MSRRLYSLITRSLWSDARFIALSPAKPNAQTLWLYLLSGDIQGPIPGLFRAGAGTLSDGLGWSVSDTARYLKEIEDSGMLKRSIRPPLIWLPNAVKHNHPNSPNVVMSWRVPLLELPECDLRDEALRGIREALSDPHKTAFDRAFPEVTGEASSGEKVSRKVPRKPRRKVHPIPPPNESPSQEQEQEQENKTSTPAELAGMRLAEELRESIRSHSPRIAAKYDKPGKLKGWAKDLEILLRVDEIPEGSARAVIRWAHRTDPRGFWRPNLLSGKKVRQHFDSLTLQAKQAGTRTEVGGGAAGPMVWIEENHAWLFRWRDSMNAQEIPLEPLGLLRHCKRDDVPVPHKPVETLRWLATR